MTEAVVRTKIEDEITDRARYVWLRHRRASLFDAPSVYGLELNLRWTGQQWYASIAALPPRTPGRWVGDSGSTATGALASLLGKLKRM